MGGVPIYARLSDAQREPNTLWAWSETTQHQSIGALYAQLGDTEKAEPALAHASGLCPASRPVAQAQIMMWHSLCRINDGDVTDGLGQAVEAVSVLPEERRTLLVRRSAVTILQTIPKQAHSLDAARELRTLTGMA
ncbi:hypothetical protein DP939_32055 [Spongiactinospora rosea]|uniref:Tetratricopeptide repeat protein n=1 Tax=Spongiactinospora rosea TaxID=2248750 RepID=A0A366LQ51_9ACTN|nr:hypothetical protein DP939_32055 [Spongiactinospora rosea]